MASVNGRHIATHHAAVGLTKRLKSETLAMMMTAKT